MITSDDISKVEKLLLPEGALFCPTRSNAIKCVESKDVIACPGSGKTTVLIAKLIILLDKMPFENNKGICVLTHTNSAIKTIKQKLGSRTSTLFKYPNYCGTIQSFVDRFLAYPAFIKQFEFKPQFIDSEKYYNVLENSFSRMNHGSYDIRQLAKQWLHRNKKGREIRFRLHNYSLAKGINGKSLRSSINKDTAIEESKQNAVYNWLKNLKLYLLEKGYLCYDDAYCLAYDYLQKLPQIKNIFEKRFKYFFLDEMQDSDFHQIKVLDKLINETNIIYQKYGDLNQSIYHEAANNEYIAWNYDVLNCIRINDSMRFHENISKVISNLRIKKDDEITGRYKSKVTSGAPNSYILIFEEKEKVIEKFKELIIEYKLHEYENPIFKAVGRIKKQSSTAISVLDYIPNFNDASTTVTTSNISLFLKKCSFNELRNFDINNLYNIIIEIFLFLLDEFGLKNKKVIKKVEREINFTKNSFIKYLSIKGKFTDFRLKVIILMKKYIKNNNSTIFKNFIIDIFNQSFKSLEASELTFLDTFLNESTFNAENTISKQMYEFEFESKKHKINFETIHAVKGETHTATLYLDTKSYGKFDSECLKKIIFEETIEITKIHEKNIKLAYVGMSRPKELLCYAIDKNNVRIEEGTDLFSYMENDVTRFENKGWKVEFV